MALLGRRLGNVLSNALTPAKTLRTENFYVKLPQVIANAEGQEFHLYVKIVDWFGTEYTSLQNTADTYGIPMASKEQLTSEDKQSMDEVYQKRPAVFKQYALNDLVLAELSSAYKEEYLRLCELLGVKESRNFARPPLTKGSR